VLVAILAVAFAAITSGVTAQPAENSAEPDPPRVEKPAFRLAAPDRAPKWIVAGQDFVVNEDLVNVHLVEGDEGEAVKQLQMRLQSLLLYRGEIDGKYGPEVEASVVAAHKLLDLDRSRTWQVSDWTSTGTISHSAVVERHPKETDRIEVDLTNQLLYVIRDAEVAAVVHVSTGNGASYWSQNGGTDGGFVRATTPRGDSAIYKHIPRWRRTYLGGLYKPWYFTPYYAVHGSRSVPSVPASHGCVRIPVWEADHLDDLLEIGLPIHIWDA
jgi:lipoprotein-anchoring transpeptidase ErfK/SrfK